MKLVAFILGCLIGFALASVLPVVGIDFPHTLVAGAVGIVLAKVA